MTKTFKILIVTNRIPYPLQDGGALAMHGMIEGYLQQGWEVGLLSMNTARHPVVQEVFEKKYGGLSFLQLEPFDNQLKPTRLLGNLIFSQLPEHVQRFYHPHFEQQLLAAIDEFSPDVIQMESTFLASYMPAIRKVTNAPVVLRMHNVEYQIWQRSAQTSKGWRSRYYKILAARMESWEERAWDLFDLLLPITREDADVVKAIGLKTPVCTVPFGITLLEPPPAVPLSFLKAFHIGAMDWQPNREAIQWFIKSVWPRVQEVAPEFRFNIAGRHLEAGFCAPLPNGITNFGTVESASTFLLDNEVLIVPLLAGGGLRIKILESMAAGKLVISTSVGMQGIAAGPQQHFLLADTIAEMVGAIKMVVNEPQAAALIAMAGQALVRENFNAEVINTMLSRRVAKLIREHKED